MVSPLGSEHQLILLLPTFLAKLSSPKPTPRLAPRATHPAHSSSPYPQRSLCPADQSIAFN